MSPQYSINTYHLNLHCSVSPFFYIWSKRGCSHRTHSSTEELKRADGVSRCIFLSSICQMQDAERAAQRVQRSKEAVVCLHRKIISALGWKNMFYVNQPTTSDIPITFVLLINLFLISYILNEHKPILIHYIKQTKKVNIKNIGLNIDIIICGKMLVHTFLFITCTFFIFEVVELKWLYGRVPIALKD